MDGFSPDGPRSRPAAIPLMNNARSPDVLASLELTGGWINEGREMALPVMRELHAALGETVNLSVRHDDEIVYVERTSSGRSAMRVVHVIGARAPLHVTAAGKLFLLEEGFARLRDYAKRTGLPSLTRNTLASLPQLERELERNQAGLRSRAPKRKA